MKNLPCCRQKDADLYVDVVVVPRSSRNSLVGIHAARLKVALRAAPVSGQANKALIEYLAKILEVPKSRLSVIQGHRSKRKRLLFEGVSVEEVCARLEKRLLSV